MLDRVPTATADLSALTAAPTARDVTFLWMPGQRSRVYVADVFIGVVGGFAIWFSVFASIKSAIEGRPTTALAYLALGLITLVTITVAIVRAPVRRRRYGVRSVVLGPRLPAFAEANGWGYDREVVPPRVAIVERGPGLNVLNSQSRDRIRSDDGGAAAPGASSSGTSSGRSTTAAARRALEPTPWPMSRCGCRVNSRSSCSSRWCRARASSSRIRTSTPAGGRLGSALHPLLPGRLRTGRAAGDAPDVMAAMIDDASAWSAQTLGGWLVFVSQQTFTRARPEAYAHALALIEVAREFREQAEHYSDSRIGDRARDVIAPQGRVLRGRRNPIFAVALLVPLAMILAFIAVPLITRGS